METDAHLTPFGKTPGALVHAYAAHALRTGQTIRRLRQGWAFPTVFALCYVIAALWSRGHGPRKLFEAAVGLTVLVWVIAAVGTDALERFLSRKRL